MVRCDACQQPTAHAVAASSGAEIVLRCERCGDNKTFRRVPPEPKRAPEPDGWDVAVVRAWPRLRAHGRGDDGCAETCGPLMVQAVSEARRVAVHAGLVVADTRAAEDVRVGLSSTEWAAVRAHARKCAGCSDIMGRVAANLQRVAEHGRVPIGGPVTQDEFRRQLADVNRRLRP